MELIESDKPYFTVQPSTTGNSSSRVFFGALRGGTNLLVSLAMLGHWQVVPVTVTTSER
jgi:hypothetical protein